MTNNELITLLKTFPENTPILTYNDETANYSYANIILELYENTEDMPYAKRDKPKITKPIILLS